MVNPSEEALLANLPAAELMAIIEKSQSEEGLDLLKKYLIPAIIREGVRNTGDEDLNRKLQKQLELAQKAQGGDKVSLYTFCEGMKAEAMLRLTGDETADADTQRVVGKWGGLSALINLVN